MGIAAKIAVGYLILVILLAGILAYEYVVILDLQESTTRLYDTYYRAGLKATGLFNDLVVIDNLLRKFFLTGGDPDYERSLQERVARVSESLREVLAIPLPESESEAFGRFQASWQAFRTAVKKSTARLGQGGGVPPSEQARVIEVAEGLLREAGELGPLTNRALLAQIDSTNASIRRVRTVVWMGGALALAAGLLVGALVVRSITLPLYRLTRATREISGGDLEVQVPESGRDEVAVLARHFNVMIRRLGESEELKSDFVSRISHELKAPMASIQETTSLLLEGIPGPLNESQNRLLRLNRDSGDRLARMINELLQLSRLESGLERTVYDRVELVGLVKTVVQEIEPICREKEVRLDFLPVQEEMHIECDPEKMIQVTRNLIDNAIKFSPPGGVVRIRLDWESEIPGSVPSSMRSGVACPTGRFLLLSVRDRGPGVADEEKERVFEKFHQSQRPRNRAGSGVGLGLAITRRLVEAHAGAIWVTDRPGGGSDFRVLVCGARASGVALPFGSLKSTG